MQRMARLLAAILALAAALFAQSPGAEQIAKIFAAYQHPDTPGCAVGVDAPERAACAAAYGMADLEHAVANTPATVFEIGSVSKQFTAAAVLLLVERGKVSLDDNIRKYFPELPALPSAHHRSGTCSIIRAACGIGANRGLSQVGRARRASTRTRTFSRL